MPEQSDIMNEGADFWYYEIGVNSIPINTQNKGKNGQLSPISYTNYQFNGKSYNLRNEMPEDVFEHLKKSNLYADGIGVAGGKIQRGKNQGLYLQMMDLDNQQAIDTIFPNGIEKLKQSTLVEQHADRLDKLHCYFITKRPMKNIASATKKNIKVELKTESSHGLHFVAPSMHASGNRYEIVSYTREPKLIEDVDNFEKKILKIACIKEEIKLKIKDNSVKAVDAEAKEKVKDTNRGGWILSKLGSYFAKIHIDEIDEIDCINKALSLNQKLGEPYDDLEKVRGLGIQFYNDYRINDDDAKLNPTQQKEIEKQWEIIKNEKSKKKDKENAKLKINEIQVLAEIPLTDFTPKNSESYITAKALLSSGLEVEKVKEKLVKLLDDPDDKLELGRIDAVLNTLSKDEKLSALDTEEIVVQEVADKILKEKNFVTNQSTKEILTWTGMIYSEEEAESFIKSKTEKNVKFCNEKIANAVVNKIKRNTYKPLKDFDSDPTKITTNTGILNLETLDQSPHSPENLTRILIPVDYIIPNYKINDDTIFEDVEKNLEGTLFWQYLTRSFTVDKEFREKDFQTVLEMFASVFIKNQVDEKAFMNLGSGKNGKTVLLDYITAMIGKNNISNEPLQKLANDTFSPAQLLNKLANIVGDLGDEELKKNSGILKDIISGGGISAQFKYAKLFEMYPTAKLIFSCNQFPKVGDQTDAFFRRWIIINWDRSFLGDPENDPTLKERLNSNRDEMNIVFSSIIHLSAKLLKKNKFSHPKKVMDVRKEWNQNADPLNAFVEKWLKDDEKVEKSLRETYVFYKNKMEDAGETPLSFRNFSKEMSEYFDQKSSNGKRSWVGFDFVTANQTTFDPTTGPSQKRISETA